MPIPKTYEECEQRARAAATEAAEAWEQRDQSVQHVSCCAEEAYQDVYSSELDVLRDLWVGNGIDRCAGELIKLCRRMRTETDAPSTLGIAVAAMLETAEERFDHDPALALREMIVSLVAIFGADAVRAAVGS